MITSLGKSIASGSSWLFSKTSAEPKQELLKIVDENNQVIAVEGFLSFEMANNRFITLLKEYLESKILSFSEKDGMVLNNKPLFDTNSIISGESQLLLLIPQNVSLEKSPVNEDLLLSHFVISAKATNIGDNEDVSFFSLNQIIGSFNSSSETIKVLHNPHTDSTETITSQILRETFIQIGDFEYPVKLLLLSDPIWIPPKVETKNLVLASPKVVIKEDNTEKEKEKEKPKQEEVDDQLTIQERFRRNYSNSQSNNIRNHVKK